MENPFKKIYREIEKRVLLNADFRDLKVVAEAKSGRSKPSSQLDYEAQTMQKQTLNEWKLAVAMATDPVEPNKLWLDKLYKNLMLDNHLASVIDSRILYCQRNPFKITNDKGDENEELSWLFERTWFEEFIKLTLLSRFEGTKLIELFELNPETKEIDYIDEIPMAYFNPLKGIITKAPGDQKGWEYKTGALQPYYIQVGKDKELGMLAQMAPIVLAKKLGLGAWLDYIEKYGVPPLFITTDREDDARLRELFNGASNFKSNAFLVGRGNEKFEIGQTNAGNPDNFDKLVERANSEISKNILGGTSLTDEKAFVGSAEIQYQLAKDRFESDKLLIKNIINQQLFPRLLKISPAYAGLANHTFEWDNSESQTLDEVKGMITALAPHFELDIEEVSQKTGMTILSQRDNSPSLGGGQGEDLKKKNLTGK